MALPIQQRDPEVTREILARWWSLKPPHADEVAIRSLSLPDNGFSNETAVVDIEWREGGARRQERFVVRIQPDAHQLFLGTDVFLQWRMIDALGRNSDVPVPTLYLKEPDPAVLGSPFFVMTFVEGEAPPDLPSYHSTGWVKELSPNMRAELATNALEAMAKIHRLDWRDGFSFLDEGQRGETGLDRYLVWVEDWYRWAATGRRFPAIEAGLRYLRDRQPTEPPIGVLWGDARMGNMLFSPDRSVAAVLDWEMAALGPPEVDLGWWLMTEQHWTQGSGLERLEGIPDRDDTIELFESLIGRPVDQILYYEILAYLRFSIVAIRSLTQKIEYGLLPESSDAPKNNPLINALAQLLRQESAFSPEH